VWRGPRGHWPGQPSRISPAQARALHSFHSRGLSLRAIARTVWERLGYSSENSCLEGLRSAFRREGLQVRSHSAATAASNRARKTVA
jgi:threonine synthase